jgi:dynein heavy chain, axonemal
VQDVFPDAAYDTQMASDAFMPQLEQAARDHLLQASPSLLSKCCQLHATLAVRFGVMVIGPAGAGKSSVLGVSRAALGLGDRCVGPTESMLDPYINPMSGNACTPDTDKGTSSGLAHEEVAGGATKMYVINPKACTSSDLYGDYNDATGEWHDGLVSAIFRRAMATGVSQTTVHEWVTFDGPVDPRWVENLNTVLDDTRTLCLGSGERMKLDATRLNVLFEVEDLRAASPATVSRCGMVYVPQCHHVGHQSTGSQGPDASACGFLWRDIYRAWLAQLPRILSHPLIHSSPSLPGLVAGAEITDLAAVTTGLEWKAGASNKRQGHALSPDGCAGLLEHLEDLFDQYLGQGLMWLQVHATEPIQSVDSQCVASLCVFLQALLHPASGWDHGEGHGAPERIALSYVFAFAFVWALGGGLRGDSRADWDSEVRRMFKGVANFPEGAATVYDFCCDPERNFTFQVFFHLNMYSLCLSVMYNPAQLPIQHADVVHHRPSRCLCDSKTIAIIQLSFAVNCHVPALLSTLRCAATRAA